MAISKHMPLALSNRPASQLPRIITTGPVEPRMQLSPSQKHVRVVDELISCNTCPRKGFLNLARLRVAVGAVHRSWADTLSTGGSPQTRRDAALQWLSA
ncbi:hypothetical protein IG631_06560 [Alternaria alternata]|jgi:hypothetical protein|nr:hypothetical protein IG631_06560 [Alternaria alternata]